MNTKPSTDFRLLINLLPPPKVAVSAPTELELDAAEISFNITLPVDYRTFIMKYGAGWIDDFIFVTPLKRGRGGSTLSQELKIYRSELSLLESGDSVLSKLKSKRPSVRLRLWPTENCVIPWGRSSNGDLLLADQENRFVYVVDNKGIDLESFEMGIIEFLVKYLRSDIVVGVFPEDSVLDIQPHVFAANFGTADESWLLS